MRKMMAILVAQFTDPAGGCKPGFDLTTGPVARATWIHAGPVQTPSSWPGGPVGYFTRQYLKSEINGK